MNPDRFLGGNSVRSYCCLFVFIMPRPAGKWCGVLLKVLLHIKWSNALIINQLKVELLCM